MKRSPEGYVGACPKCGGEDRFSINVKKNVFHCRGCGKGGDAIALVQNVEDCSFAEAVTAITGEDPPGRDAGPARELVDDPVARERREERRQQEAAVEAKEADRKSKVLEDVEALWISAQRFEGSLAQTYMKSRKIDITDDLTGDLRFVPDLTYRGYASKESEVEEPLGRFPAMLAAIRNVDGELIGLHRTYLDPKTGDKLKPPATTAAIFQRRSSAARRTVTSALGRSPSALPSAKELRRRPHGIGSGLDLIKSG